MFRVCQLHSAVIDRGWCTPTAGALRHPDRQGEEEGARPRPGAAQVPTVPGIPPEQVSDCRSMLAVQA